MNSRRIALEGVTCSSALHDSCGIVFRHDGRVFRALSSRGEHILEAIRGRCDVARLCDLGFVLPGGTDYELPGSTLVESPLIRPIVPPGMWTIEMTGLAALSILRINRALLTGGLVLWDLRNLQNMTFHHSKGPLFLDLGAVHTLEELERCELSTSFESLLDQMMDSFYLPLWLATGGLRSRGVVRRLLHAKRADPEDGLARGLIRRLSGQGWLSPGYSTFRALLGWRRLDALFSAMAQRVEGFLASFRRGQARQPAPHRTRGSAAPAGLSNALPSLVDPDDVVVALQSGPFSRDRVHSREPRSATYSFVDDPYFAPGLGQGPPPGQVELEPIPIVCNPWDRSFRNWDALHGLGDVLLLEGDTYEYCRYRRVPLDLLGRGLAHMCTRRAIVLVAANPPLPGWPGFVTPATGISPVDFAVRVVGKHFARSRVLGTGPDDLATTVIAFEKD